MKNIRILTVISLLMMAVVTMEAQQFEPLVAEGKQWNVVLTYVPWPPITRVTDAYKVEGDTVIDRMIYKKLFTTRSEHFNNWELCGLLRETEEGQVYHRNYGWNHTFGNETLLYDFAMQPGDSICCNENTSLVLLRTSDTILDDGNIRKRYDFQYKENGYLMDEHEIWIEGIGSELGLLHVGSLSLVGGTYELLCYYEGDDLIWHNSLFDSCYIDTHLADTIGTTFLDEESALYYTIISTDPPQVSVYGHVDGENAQGELDIPNGLTYEGVRYTVTEIGEWAFKNCSGLTGLLAIPPTIDTIQEGAFYGCSGFTGTLDLSFLMAVLKKNVFRECSGFTELILPYFITEIPEGLFCGCSGLTGTLVLSESESLEIIGEGAFARCSGFTGLVLPNGLREIREQAFAGCTGFTGNLVIPETVTHIKYEAFGHCTGFSGDLIIPNSVVELGNTQNSSYYVNPEPYSTFADCFDHLVLSQSLDTIGPRCFAGCTRLTGDLVLPTGLKAVFAYAFQGCTGLTGLMINDALTSIGSHAFSGCSGIRGTVTIPENISIGMAAFEWCSGIEELVLPHHIVFQSNPDKGYVFQGCTSLTELDVPEGWTRIEKDNFAYCSSLRRVHLPESLTSIDGAAFSNCTSLEEINIPEGVIDIGSSAFLRCRSLTHIELPSTLRVLGSAFAHCTSLAGEMIIPDLVQRINIMTFDSCYMLNRIVFGDSVNYIAEPAFEYTQLDSLVFKSMTPPVLQRKTTQDAWHLPSDIAIIVPCGTKEAYQNDENWSEFTNIIEDCGNGLIEFEGSEWYYEILNENGSITYQHLEYVADTTINHKDVKVIIRTNTLYDKGEHNEVTREYLYREDQLVYWWNKDLQEFTVLYDLGAQEGDSWVIKVGTETLTMHVDAVGYNYYGGQLFKMLYVSDDQDLFSGTIVSGVGHLSSFFPERLMTRGKGYGVNGLRCYWTYGNLFFDFYRGKCDDIYTNLHNGLDEPTEGAFAVYPNPTHNVLVVETCHGASLPTQTYRITNLMGQTVLTGSLTAETQQVDVSNLPQGMYFINVGDMTRKFVLR